MRRLCAMVLACEALIIALAIPVAISISHADGAVAGAVGGGAAVIALLLSGLLRYRWAYVAGSILQVLVIAAGFVVTAMFILGVIFGALWITAIFLGRSVESGEAH